MQKLKKSFITNISAAISGGLIFLATTNPVFAQTRVDTCPKDQFSPLCNLTADKFGAIVGTLVTVAFVIAVVIALAFLVWGGIRWIISGGDKAGVESARNTIIAAVIGLAIVLLSYFILNIVLKFFGIDLTNLQLPSISIQ